MSILLYVLLIGFIICISIVLLITATFMFVLSEERFKKSFFPIYDEYNITKDEKIFLEELLKIKVPTFSKRAKNAYYFNLSTAYFKNGEYLMAKECINKVRTNDTNMLDAINKQSKDIDECIK